MATAKKKAPAKKAAPAKPNYQGSLADYKASVKKPSASDASEFENEYFIRQGKAYVRLASSGDVMGPYSINSAAGRTALGNQGGGFGGARGARGNSGSGGGMRGGGGAMLGRGK